MPGIARISLDCTLKDDIDTIPATELVHMTEDLMVPSLCRQWECVYTTEMSDDDLRTLLDDVLQVTLSEALGKTVKIVAGSGTSFGWKGMLHNTRRDFTVDDQPLTVETTFQGQSEVAVIHAMYTRLDRATIQ